MKIVMLNGSPKPAKSTSLYLLEGIAPRLTTFETVWHSAHSSQPLSCAEDIKISDALLVAFPLYVDGIPAHLLDFFSQLELFLRGSGCRASVYAILNCGFYEARQCLNAMEMTRLWCEKSELQWGQGLALGAGGMGQVAPIGKGPLTSLGKSFDAMAANITALQPGETLLTHPDFPRFLYKTAAHLGWRQQGRSNGLSAKDLYHQPAFQPQETPTKKP